MKVVILRKKKSNVKVFKCCQSEDLVIMAIGAMKTAYESLVHEKMISEEHAKSIIKELICEELK